MFPSRDQHWCDCEEDSLTIHINFKTWASETYKTGLAGENRVMDKDNKDSRYFWSYAEVYVNCEKCGRVKSDLVDNVTREQFDLDRWISENLPIGKPAPMREGWEARRKYWQENRDEDGWCITVTNPKTGEEECFDREEYIRGDHLE